MEFYGNAWEGVDFKRVVRSEEGACYFDLEKGRPTWTLSLQNVLFALSPIQISRLEYFPANAHRQQLFGREWKYCLSNIGLFFYFISVLHSAIVNESCKVLPSDAEDSSYGNRFLYQSNPPPHPPHIRHSCLCRVSPYATLNSVT